MAEEFRFLTKRKKGFLIRSDNRSGKFKRACSTACPHATQRGGTGGTKISY